MDKALIHLLAYRTHSYIKYAKRLYYILNIPLLDITHFVVSRSPCVRMPISFFLTKVIY